MTNEEPTSNRRRFVKGLAISAVAAPLALADEPPKEAEKAAAQPQEEKKSEADVRMEWIVQRFGHLLDDEARKTVKAELESLVQRSERLRKLELDNGDGPFPIFVPFRGPLT